VAVEVEVDGRPGRRVGRVLGVGDVAHVVPGDGGLADAAGAAGVDGVAGGEGVGAEPGGRRDDDETEAGRPLQIAENVGFPFEAGKAGGWPRSTGLALGNRPEAPI